MENNKAENKKEEDWIFRIRRLRNVKRFNTIPILSSQNIADHSYFTAIIAMDLARRVEVQTGRSLRMEKLLQKALLHDVEEAFTGDVPHPIKRMTEYTRSFFEDLALLVRNRFLPEWVRELASLSKTGQEGHIVKLADYIELYIYCVEERLLGNRSRQLIETQAVCRKICSESIFKEIALGYLDRADTRLEKLGDTDE
jgi:5'-deoxynucleotidase